MNISFSEVPPGPPMSLNTPAVHWMEDLWQGLSPAYLSLYAYHFTQGLYQTLVNAISHMQKKQHEAAQEMKAVIEGQE